MKSRLIRVAGLVLAIAAASGCTTRRVAIWERGGDAEDPNQVQLRLDRARPYGAPAEGGGGTDSALPSEGDGMAYRLRTGDVIIINLYTPNQSQSELMIDENGFISLPLLKPIKAAGFTSSELEKEIARAYIDNKIYKYVTANISVPARSYFIRGEVRSPGRYPLVGTVTVLQAIAAAGGYTDFANTRKVEIVRGNKTLPVDAKELQESPERDFNIVVGDVIVVHRSWY